MQKINVRSHVGRDLLQSAEHFRTDRAVIWEYVANGLQYHASGVPPVVRVSIDDKRKVMRVSDNGCGMNRNDLVHFFTMHGENRERVAGRAGRGLFGTGKSAAFAIADSLRVTSVKNGLRSVALLTRSRIESANDGKEVPVDLIEVEAPTSEPNGTEIEIAGIHLKRIDRAAIIRHVEHHLAHYPQDVQVYVDHHQCFFRAPEIAESQQFRPSDEERVVLGDVLLTVNVARGPLDDDVRGVQIFSLGNWHETTLAGCDGKEMAEYLFGEIDVPAIEQYSGPNRPFDNTRSGKLNPGNEVVECLFRFIGPKIDATRRALVAREKERSRTEEAKRLQRQASRIADVLSTDFADYQMKVARAQAASRGRDLGPAQAVGAESLVGPWKEGGPEPATPVERARNNKTREGDAGGSSDLPEFSKPVTPEPSGSTTGSGSKEGGAQRAPRGGFSVRYEHSGESETRGKYVADRRSIIINLDHPQVKAAFDIGGAETETFLRLTIEVAISEYSLALAQELVEQYGLVDEALFDIRGSIDRVSRRMVPIYRSAA